MHRIVLQQVGEGLCVGDIVHGDELDFAFLAAARPTVRSAQTR